MNPGALADHLHAAGLCAAGATIQVTPCAGGAVRRNWRVDLGDGAVFAVRAPAPVGLRDSHPLRVEYDIQKAANAAGIATPRPLHYADDTSVLDTPFYVAQFVPGTAEPAVINAFSESRRHAIANRLGEQLAKVHTKLFHMKQSPQVAVDNRWTHGEQLRADAQNGLIDGGDDPLLRDAIDWLAANDPGADQTVFAHRDFRVGNVLVDDGAFATVLDWEFARPSDPHEDLGWFTAHCWRRLTPDTADHAAGGLAPLDTFLAAYRHPVDADKLAYWQIAAHIRWAVIARQQIARAAAVPDPQLAALRDYLPGLRDAIAAMIAAPPQRTLDRLAHRTV